MAAKTLSIDDILARLTEAQKHLATAKAALAAAEADADQKSVSQPLDDLRLARQAKQMSEYRDAVQRWADELNRLERMLDHAAKVQQERALAKKVAEVAAGSQLRTELATKLDMQILEVAKTLNDFSDKNSEIIALLPSRPQDLPPMFTGDGLRRRVDLRLLALAPKIWTTARMGMTPWDAQRLSSLSEAAEAEQKRLLSHFPPSNDGPGAA